MKDIVLVVAVAAAGALSAWHFRSAAIDTEREETQRATSSLNNAGERLARVLAECQQAMHECTTLSAKRDSLADAEQRLEALARQESEINELRARRDAANGERARVERLMASLHRKAAVRSSKLIRKQASAGPEAESKTVPTPAPDVPRPSTPTNASMTILFGDYTHAQRVRLDRKYLHKRLRISGAALDLRPLRGGAGHLLTLGDPNRWKWGKYYITCYVRAQDVGDLRGIQRKGQLVTVVGRLTEWNSKWAVMYECRVSK